MCRRQAIEDVDLPQRPLLKMILKYMDKVFTVIFVGEMIIKMSAYGWKKYFTDAWCWLDFIIVVVRDYPHHCHHHRRRRHHHSLVFSVQRHCVLKNIRSFIHSFVHSGHSGHFYSAFSSPLLPRSAPDTAGYCAGVSRRSATGNCE